MKKILKLITPLLAMLVLLTACSSEKTKEFIKNSDGHEIKTTLYYKGDVVNKSVTVDTIIDNKYNLTVDFVKQALQHNIENISGYTYNVEDKDGKITKADINKEPTRFIAKTMIIAITIANIRL